MSCRLTVMFERPCVFWGCALWVWLDKKKSQRDFIIVVRDGGMEMEMECKSTQPAHLFFVFGSRGSSWSRKRGFRLMLMVGLVALRRIILHPSSYHPIIRTVRRLACSPQYQYQYIIYICVCVRYLPTSTDIIIYPKRTSLIRPIHTQLLSNRSWCVKPWPVSKKNKNNKTPTYEDRPSLHPNDTMIKINI